MSKQIAVRLSDDLVEFIDEIIGSGRERSRAAVVSRALERERRRAARGRASAIQVPVGVANGLDKPSVVACDHVTTIPKDALGSRIGLLLDDQE